MRPLACLFLCLSAACYTYVPLETQPPARGTDVQARLTDHGTAEMARLVGPRVAAIQGRVFDSGADTLSVAVSTVILHSGVDNIWSGEPVAIPREYIANLERRKFSAARTSLVVLAIVAGIVAADQALGSPIGDLFGRGGGDGGRPQ